MKLIFAVIFFMGMIIYNYYEDNKIRKILKKGKEIRVLDRETVIVPCSDISVKRIDFNNSGTRDASYMRCITKYMGVQHEFLSDTIAISPQALELILSQMNTIKVYVDKSDSARYAFDLSFLGENAGEPF